MYVYLTMVVPPALCKQCNDLAYVAAGAAGKDVWSSGYSPTGQMPITLYIASGAVGDNMAYLLTHPDALAEATGLTLAQAQALLAQCEIIPLGQNTAPEGQPPNAETLDETLARLGLKMVQSEL